MYDNLRCVEVEIKFKLESGVRERIENIAKFLGEVREEDYYFNHPCRDFGKSDEALRVRKSNKVLLTYKGPKVDRETKTRVEIEVEVEDFEKILKILKELGFRFFAKVSKVRRLYVFNDVKITIDRVEGLGDFVEIELESDDLEKAKERVFEIARMLGLKGVIRESYLELLRKNH